MKKKHKLILLSVFVIYLASCESERCFHGTGSAINAVMLSDSFSSVYVYGLFDVELVQDTCYYVEGIGGEKVLQNIGLQLNADTLELYNYNNCFWLRDYKRPLLRIHFSDIYNFIIFETSYVFSKDSITDDFRLISPAPLSEINLIFNNRSFFFYNHRVSGGKFTFSGKSKDAYIDAYYSSVLDASNLELKKAWVRNHSINDFKVWVTDELRAEVYNRGNIYYKGNPKISIDTMASTGKVLPLLEKEIKK